MCFWLIKGSSCNAIVLKYFKISLALMCLIALASTEECKYVNPCRCEFQNGSVIDLSSLGDQDHARWQYMKPVKNESYHYYYNPCYNFKLGNGDCSSGVAVCQVSKDNTSYFSCGDQEHAFFSWSSKKNAVILSYHRSKRTTNVTLVCSDNSENQLVVSGETSPDSETYEMTLTSRCACPDFCRSDGLSTGSALVIILLIFMCLYIFLGIVYNHLARGAHGWELFPHYEFWTDFPLLVKDGCVFVSSGCRRETSYERI